MTVVFISLFITVMRHRDAIENYNGDAIRHLLTRRKFAREGQ